MNIEGLLIGLGAPVIIGFASGFASTLIWNVFKPRVKKYFHELFLNADGNVENVIQQYIKNPIIRELFLTAFLNAEKQFKNYAGSDKGQKKMEWAKNWIRKTNKFDFLDDILADIAQIIYDELMSVQVGKKIV